MPEFVGGIKYPVPGDAYNSTYGEPQWWKDLAETASAQIAAKADAGHSHSWAQITGKPSSFPSAWADVSGKPSTFPPSSHTHSWGEVTGKPSSFTPSAHTHSGLSNGTFSVDLSSAGAFALRSGSSNTVQWNASNGNLVAGNVPWARVTERPTSFPSSWADVSGKPSTYPPESHSHSGISNGSFTWSVTSAGAIAANAGGSNTWQIDANSGRLIAGEVPWARLSGAPDLSALEALTYDSGVRNVAQAFLGDFTTHTAWVELQRIGPNVEFSLFARPFDKAEAATGTLLFTLPSGFRPRSTYRVSTPAPSTGQVTIATNGTVTLSVGSIPLGGFVTFTFRHLTGDPVPSTLPGV